MRACIIGLPLCGKTTLYHAIAGQHGQAAPVRPDEILRVMIKIPDSRLDGLARIARPQKISPATLELEDAGALFEDKHGAHVIHAATLAAVRDADGLIVVLRAFNNPGVPAPKGIDLVRDADHLHDELVLADLGVAEKRLERLEKDMTKPTDHQLQDKAQYEVLKVCKEALEKGASLRSLSLSADKLRLISNFSFLSLKPVVCVVNTSDAPVVAEPMLGELRKRFQVVLAISAQTEMEIMELEPAERAEFLKDAGIEEPAAGRIIHACYEALDLRSFLTQGPKEVHAWTIHAGDNAVTAAEEIHTDIARGFIRAEVVRYEDLIACGSIKEARNQGKVRLEGKDYIVQDGDVIEFRFNV